MGSDPAACAGRFGSPHGLQSSPRCCRWWPNPRTPQHLFQFANALR